MKYQCSKCSEIFTHTAKLTIHDNTGLSVASQDFKEAETSVCPFCHNVKFTEYIEPAEEFDPALLVKSDGKNKEEINDYLKAGYKIRSESATGVWLYKPKPKEALT